jgi:plastocyanin
VKEAGMNSKRTRLVLVAGFALVAALGACGGSDKPSGAKRSADAVSITGFLFKPETLAVAAGTIVTWTNSDDIDHTVTSGTPEAPATEFDSGNKAKGQTFSHVFASRGTFAYFCKNHNGMRGEVAVT